VTGGGGGGGVGRVSQVKVWHCMAGRAKWGKKKKKKKKRKKNGRMDRRTYVEDRSVVYMYIYVYVRACVRADVIGSGSAGLSACILLRM